MLHLIDEQEFVGVEQYEAEIGEAVLVGVGGEKDASRVGMDGPRPLEEVDAGHAGHALVADQKCDGLLAGLELGEGVESGLSAGRTHHTVAGTVLPAQVLHDSFKNVDIVIDGQQNGSRHTSECRALPPVWG